MKNVIILTVGLSGSSVLTGLIARAGFWTGEDTFKKKDYNTYENQGLVDHNRKILADVDYQGRYEMVFDQKDIDEIERKGKLLDLAPYSDFLRRCNEHRPWVWKDPRLWLTIRVWRPLLDLDNINFLLLSRDNTQSWISTTIRRQIQTRDYANRYSNGIRNSLRKFLEENNCSYRELVYEDLLMNPEQTIEGINQLLSTNLSVEDLKEVYRGDLYQKPKGFADLVKAYLIYFKNYSERYR